MLLFIFIGLTGTNFVPPVTPSVNNRHRLLAIFRFRRPRRRF